MTDDDEQTEARATDEAERWKLEDLYARLSRTRPWYSRKDPPITSLADALAEILNRIERLEDTDRRP